MTRNPEYAAELVRLSEQELRVYLILVEMEPNQSLRDLAVRDDRAAAAKEAAVRCCGGAIDPPDALVREAHFLLSHLDTRRHSTAAIENKYFIPVVLTGRNAETFTNRKHSMFLTTHIRHRHIAGETPITLLNNENAGASPAVMDDIVRIAVAELTGDRYTMPPGTTSSNPVRIMKGSAIDNWQCPCKRRGHCDWQTNQCLCKCSYCARCPDNVRCIFEVPLRQLEAAAAADPEVLSVPEGETRDAARAKVPGARLCLQGGGGGGEGAPAVCAPVLPLLEN